MEEGMAILQRAEKGKSLEEIKHWKHQNNVKGVSYTVSQITVLQAERVEMWTKHNNCAYLLECYMSDME